MRRWRHGGSGRADRDVGFGWAGASGDAGGHCTSCQFLTCECAGQQPSKSTAVAEMARGSSGEVAHVELMEQGVCNVVHGNTVNQRAAYVRRLAAVGLTLLAAAVVCAALVGGSTPAANQVSACA